MADPKAEKADVVLVGAGIRTAVAVDGRTSADDSIAGLLGASPGGWTALPAMLDVMQRCFGDRYRGDRLIAAEL